MIPASFHMKFLSIFCLSLLFTAPLLTAKKKQKEISNHFTITYQIYGAYGRAYGYLHYGPLTIQEHKGISGIRLNLPSTYKVERDENDLPTMIISPPYEVLIRPTEEEWAAEDPHAFDCVFRYHDNQQIYCIGTIARIKSNERDIMVMRTLNFGNRPGDPAGMVRKAGEIDRIEFDHPEPGIAFVTKGLEIDGKFIPSSRNTFLKYLDDQHININRSIDEVFSKETQTWIVESDVLREKRRFDYGSWHDVRSIHNPDGDAIVEEWEHYTNGQRTGPDGNLSKGVNVKRHRQKDGTETFYQYLKNHGTFQETRHPNGDITIKSKSVEILGENHHIKTSIEKRNGKEFYRKILESMPAKIIETICIPGRPDRVTVYEYYPKDQEFGGSEKRITYPDGTMKTIDRMTLDDGSRKVIEEYGTHDGERVIEGTRTTYIYGDRPDSGKTTEPINRR